MFWIYALMVFIIVAPIVLMVWGLYRIKKHREKAKAQWLAAREQVADDPEALALWETLNAIRSF